MSEESRVSRTPRTWTHMQPGWRDYGDCQQVRDNEGRIWTRQPSDLWTKNWKGTFGWLRILAEYGPLVEVLPDAPEPTAQTDASETNTAPTGEHTNQDGAAVYGELSDRLADLIFEYTRFVRREDCDDPARAILAAGWRPPLSGDESAEGWERRCGEMAARANRWAAERDEARSKLDQLRSDIENHRGLGEEIALAIQDVYSGETFADPTFERGTEAVLNVLRERLAAPVTDPEVQP